MGYGNKIWYHGFGNASNEEDKNHIEGIFRKASCVISESQPTASKG